jgi:hypothetical protein
MEKKGGMTIYAQHFFTSEIRESLTAASFVKCNCQTIKKDAW